MVPYGRLGRGRFSMVIFLSITIICLFTASYVYSAATLTLDSPIFVDGDTDPVVHWAGVEHPKSSDIIQIYSIDASQSLPVTNSADKMRVFFLRVIDWDPQLAGHGSASFPVYPSRDRAFYLEYIQYDDIDNNDTSSHSQHALLQSEYYNRDTTFEQRQQRDQQLNSLGSIVAYVALYWADTSIPAFHLRLSLTHNPTEMQLMYTTCQSQYKKQHFVKYWPISSSISSSSIHQQQLQQTSQLQSLPTQHAPSYTMKQMKEEPATSPEYWLDPGEFREVIMTNLESNTIYNYCISSTSGSMTIPLLNDRQEMKKSQNCLSNIFQFTSPVSSTSTNSNDRFTNIYIFGDLGVGFKPGIFAHNEQQNPAIETCTNIAEDLETRRNNGDNNHTSLLLIGDISYARGYHIRWDYFFQQIEPLTSTIPFHVALGNHDYDYWEQDWIPPLPDRGSFGHDSGGEAGIPTFARFRNPIDWAYPPYDDKSIYSDSTTQKYLAKGEHGISYSYNTGVMHIIVFSTEHDFSQGSAQWNWLQQDLASINRQQTPWVIVTGHRPPYCTTSGCSIDHTAENPQGIDYYIREQIHQLMLKYRVNLGIFGHNHHYERGCPIVELNGYRCAENYYSVVDGNAHIKSKTGPIFVVSGASGNTYEPNYQPFDPYVNGTTSPTDNHHLEPEFNLFRTMTFGYTFLTADEHKLTFTFYNNKARTIHDRFILTDPI